MNIPDFLIDEIRAGKVVLFLGSGASIGAASPTQPFSPPVGKGLGDLLSDKFLGGKEKDKSLSAIAEYSIARSDIRTVQNFIKNIFSPFVPSVAQIKIANFKWAALVTTNYDQIIERAYAENNQRLQTPVPFLKSSDRVDNELKGIDKVALLKLHGCISITDDDRYPLILTVEQYITHRKNREKLFNRFTEYAGEYTVVFVGYRLEDPNIRAILLELATPEMSRPRHYVVTPGASELDKLVWESKNISTLDGTFDEFLSKIDEKIPAAFRAIRLDLPDHPIARRFSSHGVLTQSTTSFLLNDATYVYDGMISDTPDAHAFYKGASFGWGSIIAGFDASRNITDTFLLQAVLIEESQRPRRSDMYLLKGYAGSGKTVELKRLAYETGVTFNCPVLYIRSDSRIMVEPIDELCRLINERIYIFIDGAARRTSEIDMFVRAARGRDLKVTLILAERTNEWNVECQLLSSLVDYEHELRQLSSNEVDSILEKLEEYNELGILKSKTVSERKSAFMDYANRQLLVALYEVTSGKPFQDIVYDEYRHIFDDKARRMYLVICSLNRLNVPVRAGLVNRICGISFHDFKNSFFSPLESIVLTEEYKPALDMAYRARHPWIAQIVFERALPTEYDRFDLYMSLIKAIDVGYSPDRSAFREMIRAKNILEIFSSPNLINEIFDTAMDGNNRDGYLYQQRAIYEFKRTDGNFQRASDFLLKAKEILPKDKSILHSMSELEMVRARFSKSTIERHKHFEQAKDYALELTGSNAETSHGFFTLAKLALEKFKELLGQVNSNDEQLSTSAKSVEKALTTGLERFRSDEFLLTIEADFSTLLRDEARATKSLQTAFSINPGSSFVAKSLSRLLASRGDYVGARSTLSQALRIVPGDKNLNAALARIIEKNFPQDLAEAESCWRRSYTSGDTNYTSQFYCARRLYLNDKIEEAQAIFASLRLARVSHDVKVDISGWIKENGTLKEFSGILKKIEEDYAIVIPFGQSTGIGLSRSQVSSDAWEKLKMGDQISFAVGFNYIGLAASVIKLQKNTDN